MPHTFVVAKLIPQRSAYWTSGYGILKATSLATRPFLALRISRTDIGYDDHWREGDFLFAISPQKPSGVNEGCYFALRSSLDEGSKMLHVQPPLHPKGGTLYVHTFPKLLEHLELDPPVSVAHLPHQLEESSYLAFCRSVLDDYDKILQENTRMARMNAHLVVVNRWGTNGIRGKPTNKRRGRSNKMVTCSNIWNHGVSTCLLSNHRPFIKIYFSITSMLPLLCAFRYPHSY